MCNEKALNPVFSLKGGGRGEGEGEGRGWKRGRIAIFRIPLVVE